jgi:hypothetical protein
MRVLSSALIATTFLVPSSVYAQTVGKAVSVRTTVTGDQGELKRADPVSRNERIRTNNTGLGQFQFIDGTKLAVGPNSTVVVDDYVLGSGNRVNKLALNATKGTLRWISGRSPSTAYSISTSAGVLGVRGTAVDIAVRGNTAMMVLLNGAARWCARNDPNNCVVVDRPCDFIVARGGNISQPERVSGAAVNEFGASSFPFLINNQRLLPSFRLGRANCGLGIGRFPSRSGDGKSTPARTPPQRSVGDGKDGGGEEGGGNNEQ